MVIIMGMTLSLIYKTEQDLVKFVELNNLHNNKHLFVQIFSTNCRNDNFSKIRQVIAKYVPQAMVIVGEVDNEAVLKKIIKDNEYLILITPFEKVEWKTMLKKMNASGSFYHLIEKNEEKIKELHDSLSTTEAQYKSLFENNSDFIFSTNLNGIFTSVNPAFVETFGFQKDEVIGQKFNTFIYEEDLQKVRQYYNDIMDGSKLCFTVNIPCKHGELQVCQITIIPITKGDSLVGVYGIGRNITKQIEIEQRITNLKLYDFDTGLPNRLKLTEELREWIKAAKNKHEEFAVIFVDIDRFKNINDSFGHYVGDIVLKELAERINSLLPKTSVLARFEGDKFAVLIGAEELDSIMNLTNKILARIYQPIMHEDLDFFVTASIGVSMYPEDGFTEESLLKHADLAMHQSKNEGGNRVTFYCTNMNKKAMDRLKLESYLRKALKNDEFFLVYQPLIDLSNGKMFGSEALIRWNSPELGIIPPLQFIPIAEEIGIINEIGKWVLNTACQQNKKWQTDGLGELTISVNVSARQFQEWTFIDDVKEALTKADLEPEYLMLELTESVMLNNIDYSISIMKELQSLGVKVSVDDFGTGYSALNYLKNLPIDSLKIDRSFINNLHIEDSDVAIVKAIITMGQGLEVRVVAEGVETKEQLSLLKELDCNYAQGYYIDRPLLASEFEAFRKRN